MMVVTAATHSTIARSSRNVCELSMCTVASRNLSLWRRRCARVRAIALRSQLAERPLVNQAGLALQPSALLLENQWRAADSRPLEVDVHLDAIGDSDKRNAAVHPVVLAVEVQRPGNPAGAGTNAGHRKCQRLGSGNSADRKVAVHLEGGGTGLGNTRRLERDQRIVGGVEEV